KLAIEDDEAGVLDHGAESTQVVGIDIELHGSVHADLRGACAARRRNSGSFPASGTCTPNTHSRRRRSPTSHQPSRQGSSVTTSMTSPRGSSASARRMKKHLRE